jgi:hypothetical protein
MKTSLKFERETKNTNVYKNDQEGAPHPIALYCQVGFRRQRASCVDHCGNQGDQFQVTLSSEIAVNLYGEPCAPLFIGI